MTTYWFDCLPLHPAPNPLESFSGYLIRLAELNQIDTVSGLGYALFPRTRYRPHYQGWYMDVPLQEFEYMPEATCCSPAQLQATTIHHLLVKFGNMETYPFLWHEWGAYLRYCPTCLAEHPYHRLTWRFLSLPGCAPHGCYLLDCCGHCGQRIPLIPYRPLRIGWCPVCGGDLRTGATQELSGDDLSLTRKRTADLEYLLTPQAWESDPGHIIPSARTWLCFLRQEQRLSQVDVARILGVASATVRAMESLTRRRDCAFLENYLKYTDVLNTTWHEIFDHMAQHFQQTPANAFQLRSASLLKQVETAIQYLEQTGQRVSKTAIEREVGLSQLCLRHYPGVDQVLHHLPEYIRNKQEQQLLTKIHAAANQLRDQGQPITQQALRRMVPGCPISTRRYPAAVALVDRLAIPTPYKESVEHKQQRDEELLRQAHQIVDDMQANHQRVTPQAVSQTLGIELHVLHRYPQVTAWLYATVEQLRQQERQHREDELVTRVEAVIQQLEKEGKSVTQLAITQMMEMTPGRLKKYARVKALLPQLQRLPPED